MKKAIFLLVFVLAGTVTFAQSLDDVRDELGKKDFDIAKVKGMIDKYLSNPKNAAKADGWYYKGYIYNAASKNEATKASCADCRMEAFEAFKKYQELDSKNVLMTLEQNVSFFDIYNNYFEIGAKAFNEKKYPEALTNFKNALTVEEYVRGKGFDYNGFKFPALDTSLLLNTALSAKLSEKEEEAVVFYKKLAAANLSAPEYLEIYEYLADFYRRKKDATGFAAAIEQGKKLYPAEEYWTVVEIEQATEGLTGEALFNKYDELLAKYPANYTLAYNYSVELYNYVYVNSDKTIKADHLKPRLHELLKKAAAIKSTGDVNLLLARYLYNSSFDKADDARKIKGAKPEDVKKRKELNDASSAEMTECIPYAEAAVAYFAAIPKLKPIEKANYRSTLSILQSIYEAKKNPAKAAEYAAKVKAVE